MPLYTRAMDLGLAMPIPPHVFLAPPDNGLAAFTARRRIDRVIAALVTSHGAPKRKPYLIPETRRTPKGKIKPTGRMVPGPPPAASARVARVARAAGFEVIERRTVDSHIVEGLHAERGVGFRAYWKHGKADGATWHVRGRDVYTLIDDPRPMAVSKTSRVGLVGKRSPGTPRVHLSLVSSARGMGINITELEKRIKA